MAPLSAASTSPSLNLILSKAALAKLRAYKPPPFDSVWNHLPLSRRAAVLVLLFVDRRGDLRVVLTIRSSTRMPHAPLKPRFSIPNNPIPQFHIRASRHHSSSFGHNPNPSFSSNILRDRKLLTPDLTVRSFSGQAAFPGGKADSLSEEPFEIARREASEEIGLPRQDHKIPGPFKIEHLCQLPLSLAISELVVRPCVAFLHADETIRGRDATVEEDMIPRLDAREVAAVFSAPFHNFLHIEDEVRKEDEPSLPGSKRDWYSGAWHEWHDAKWRMHKFYVPITNQKVSKPKVREGGQAAIADQLDEQEEQGLTRYKVWGMTAKILVDAARIAYEEEPEFEHNAHVGDEDLIAKLQSRGHFEKISGRKDVTDAEINAARIKIKEERSGAKI